MWAFRKGCSWWDGGWGRRRAGGVRGGVAGLEALLGEGREAAGPGRPWSCCPLRASILAPEPLPVCWVAWLRATPHFFFNGNIWNLPLRLLSQFQLLFLQTPEHAASHLRSGFGVISWTWPPACSLPAQPALAQGHSHPQVDAIGRDGECQRPLLGWRRDTGWRTLGTITCSQAGLRESAEGL